MQQRSEKSFRHVVSGSVRSVVICLGCLGILFTPGAPVYAEVHAHAQGTSRRLRECVKEGLDWLAAHQDPESGAWSAEGELEGEFGRCPDEENRCPSTGGWGNDIGVTALALLAFLGDLDSNPRFRETATKAVDYLIRYQRFQSTDGVLAQEPANRLSRDHYIATLALAEAAAKLDRADAREAVQQALEFTYRTQTPAGGWRYCYDKAKWAQRKQRSEDGLKDWAYPDWFFEDDVEQDVRSTGWALASLVAAKRAHIEVDEVALARGLSFLSACVDVDGRQPFALFEDHLADLQRKLDQWREEWKRVKESADRPRGLESATDYKKWLKEQVAEVKRLVRRGVQPTGKVTYDGKGQHWETVWWNWKRGWVEQPRNEELVAIALLFRLHAIDADEPKLLDDVTRLMLQRCLAVAPTASQASSVDLSFCYWTVLALDHPATRRSAGVEWMRALEKALPLVQSRSGHLRGSCDQGLHGGGRVASTALLTLAAQGFGNG